MKYFFKIENRQESFILYIIGIKICLHKRRRYLLNKFSNILKIFGKCTKNSKYYSNIVSLGRNCEFSMSFVKYHSFIDSTVFSWASALDGYKMINCLQNLDEIFSQSLQYDEEMEMWKDYKFGLYFHGKYVPQDLMINGSINFQRLQEDKEELVSRMKYLVSKTKDILNSYEKKLFVITVDLKLYDNPLDFLDNLLITLNNISLNFDLLVIIEKCQYSTIIKEWNKKYNNVYIRSLTTFANIKTANKPLDVWGWTKILNEFKPKIIKKQELHLKCDKNTTNNINYNRSLIKFFVGILVFIVTINYFINPYNIFEQHIFKRSLLKPEAKVQERLTKPLGFKFNQRKIDTVFIGTSRSDYSISSISFNKLANKTSENLAMGGLNTDELVEIIDIALKIHPEIKNIYIELNYGMFDRDHNKRDYRAEITKDPALNPTDFGVALLSGKSIGNAFWSIIKSLSGNKKRAFYSSGEKVIFQNPEIWQEFKNLWGGYGNFNYDANKTEQISSYVSNLKKQDKNIVFYVYPSHITEFYFIYKNGQQNNYENWKKSFAKIAPLYDFQYPNEFTTDEIRPEMDTYFDASHGTYIVGNKIIEDLVNCSKKGCKYARYVTGKNVDIINKKNAEGVKIWIKNNPELINKINQEVE